jgi:hypothetical protein
VFAVEGKKEWAGDEEAEEADGGEAEVGPGEKDEAPGTPVGGVEMPGGGKVEGRFRVLGGFPESGEGDIGEKPGANGGVEVVLVGAKGFSQDEEWEPGGAEAKGVVGITEALANEIGTGEADGADGVGVETDAVAGEGIAGGRAGTGDDEWSHAPAGFALAAVNVAARG